jgi:hypothetical protein
MQYLQYMVRVLRFEEAVYREIITQERLSLWYTALNVAVFGLLYGLSAIHYSSFLLSPDGGGDTAPLPLNVKTTILFMGISVAFLIHGGMALFAWVFCRGFGGSTLFLPVYLALGIAWLSLWPLAPILAASQVKLAGNGMYFLLLLVAAYALGVVFRALKSASGLSFNRMLVVISVVIIYIFCFMYLWVG